MKAFIEQFVAIFKAMPLTKKITMGVVLAVVVAGFALMFFWANKVDYQVLYTNLSQEDAGEIVAKLREQRIPYQLSAGGSSVSVPAENVYELRLALAKDGIPAGGHVGFEIFDQTNFSTTEFVQRLNYQRALQGELVRTITDFREVESARVLLALPEESLFVEDTKPPSASVLLKLKSPLSPDKISGIVHLVASAVEGLSTNQVTVVDTAGRVLYKGPNEGSDSALLASNQLDYQRETEKRIGDRIQSLLEGIVGKGKAIVRVSADIDFDQVDLSEEKYDPDSSVIRSEQRRVETSVDNENNVRTGIGQEAIVSTGTTGAGTRAQKQDEVINYEINRVTRHVLKTSGGINRLSVAAAVDGTYETVTGEDGTETKKFIPRGEEELLEFEKMIKRAMGFNADREDQVYVSSFAISGSSDYALPDNGIDWLGMARQYVKTILNIVLVFLVFFFVVRPMLKSFRSIQTAPDTAQQALPEEEGSGEEPAKLPGPREDAGIREKTLSIVRNNPERTEQFIRGWLQGGS